MGLFNFGKKKVIDLRGYQKPEGKQNLVREETRIQNPSQNTSSLGFLGDLASNSQIGNLTGDEGYPDSSQDIDEKKRKLAKRLMDITEKIEDLSNQIYHIQQRIEVLEKKLKVNHFD